MGFAERRSQTAHLVPYGHPATWPMPGPTRSEALRLLTREHTGPAYVLGIDQAEHSGWAVHDFTRVALHGRASCAPERAAAMRAVRALPGFTIERLLVVLEDHSHIPLRKGGNAKTVLGMGDARGRWRERIETLGLPKHLQLMAAPDEWRRVMGTRCNLSTEAWKAQALLWATATLGQKVTDDNEAEACVLATWGSFHGLAEWASKRVAKRRSA